jgi:hypothetical protein
MLWRAVNVINTASFLKSTIDKESFLKTTDNTIMNCEIRDLVKGGIKISWYTRKYNIYDQQQSTTYPTAIFTKIQLPNTFLGPSRNRMLSTSGQELITYWKTSVTTLDTIWLSLHPDVK